MKKFFTTTTTAQRLNIPDSKNSGEEPIVDCSKENIPLSQESTIDCNKDNSLSSPAGLQIVLLAVRGKKINV